MKTEEKNNKLGSQAIALAVVALVGMGGSTYLYLQRSNLQASLDSSIRNSARLTEEQRNAQAQLDHSLSLLDSERQARQGTEEQLREKDAQLKEIVLRTASLEQRAARTASQEKELAALRTSAQQLTDELASARSLELDLRADVVKVGGERDALTHQLNLRETGARMVNNAEIVARHGKKGKLTVKARKTNSVHMAFDLPTSLAKGANFAITGPDGKNHEGGGPALSVAHDRSDATASIADGAAPSELSRVDLDFKPKEKLVPGVYRIDVRSGKDYLQTVYLNLR